MTQARRTVLLQNGMRLRGFDPLGQIREVLTEAGDTQPGLQVNQRGTGRLVDFQDDGVSRLHVLDGGRVVLANSIEIGATPATTGAIRVQNNAAITARNSGNTADVPLLALDDSATNTVELGNSAIARVRIGAAAQPAVIIVPTLGLVPTGDAAAPFGGAANRWTNGFFSGALIVGTNPADAGAMRLANAGQIVWRNAANSGNAGMVRVNAANELSLGVTPGTDDWSVVAGGHLTPAITNTRDLGAPTVGVRIVYVGTAVAIGTNPAATGAVRIANAANITARNAANAADINLMALDASDRLNLNLNTLSLVLNSPLTQLTVGAAGAAAALPATPTGYLRWTNGVTQFVWPYYAQA